MQTFFSNYPKFIETDNRVNRTNPNDGYPVSAEFLSTRYKCMLPVETCKGKRILDLGSCTASLGAWVLANGADHYTGVELQKKYVSDSKNNLATYFQNNWNIVESTVEDFLEKNTDKFDIAVASGIIYSVSDSYRFLTQLSNIADYLIIEARHPPTMRQFASSTPNIIKGIEFEKKFIELTVVSMIHEDANSVAKTLAFTPTVGALITMMRSLDFVADIDVYNNLNEHITDIYGLGTKYSRYGIGFRREFVADKLKPFKDVYTDPKLLKLALRKFQ
jgi:precorrin-6B methylase 2